MKEIAKSVTAMATSEAMTTILDRRSSTSALLDIAHDLLDHWKFDLYARRPGPALLENGVLSPTDLDLACFMSALADRRAVINIPTYKSRRPRVEREHERVVSTKNRHGKIAGLVANKEAFSFSVRIEDMNVITRDAKTEEEKIGAFRNFMLVDVDGTWHDGWRSIEFMPNCKENAFLADKKLWTNHTVVFQNFVHPNRWTSLYGQYYFLTKVLMQRLTDENIFRREEQNRLLEEGCFFILGAPQEKGKQEPTGGTSSVTVSAFEVETDAPWTRTFERLRASNSVLEENAQHVRYTTYTLLPKLRFAVRATELAFYNRLEGRGVFASRNFEIPFASWIKNAKWEDFTAKGKRKNWKRLVLAQLFPGRPGFALRFRTWSKKERVAA